MAGSTKGLGKLKAIIGAAAGLMSGAVLMYVSPFIDKVVKPGTPIANFETRQDGLTVTFHNLSGGARNLEGWWDFGDGSPLVPIVADQELSHTYPKPGGYTAKLSVRNMLGDANDRSVSLQLESGAADEAPRILTLDAVPLTPQSLAPATFKVATEVKNASLAVWDLDEGRPLEVTPSPTGRQERLVTFEKPGGYVIKVAAFNGQQHEQKTVVVNVKPAPAGSLTAYLSVNTQATQVERKDRRYNFSANFPSDHKGNSYPFKLPVSATNGWAIADVIAVGPTGSGPSLSGQASLNLDGGALKAGPVRNLQLQRDSDGKKVFLTGELTRGSDKERPAMMLTAILREERRKPASSIAPPVMAALTMPGTTSLAVPPMPQGWEAPKHAMHFELRDGRTPVWKGDKLPHNEAMSYRGKRWLVNAVQTGEKVEIVLNETR